MFPAKILFITVFTLFIGGIISSSPFDVNIGKFLILLIHCINGFIYVKFRWNL